MNPRQLVELYVIDAQRNERQMTGRIENELEHFGSTALINSVHLAVLHIRTQVWRTIGWIVGAEIK